MEYKDVTETIIGCAYRVYNKMGFGFLESVYQKCLLIELRKTGLNTKSEKPITVYYDNEIVGEFITDIIVNDAIILELKSVRRIIKAHACRSDAQIPLSGPREIHVNDSKAYFTGEVQLVNYLVATGEPVGLILNFGEKKVEIKRKVKDLN